MRLRKEHRHFFTPPAAMNKFQHPKHASCGPLLRFLMPGVLDHFRHSTALSASD
jgi:hypothetical protein